VTRRVAPVPAPVVAFADIAAAVGRWLASGERVVLAHGRFDLLHADDARVMAGARAHGTRLVAVVVDAPGDDRGRAWSPAADRAELVAALRGVDLVTIATASELAGLTGAIAVALPERAAGAPPFAAVVHVDPDGRAAAARVAAIRARQGSAR
jgi:Cytidylyltransferase-like